MNISALRYRDFRIYIIGNMFALNGLWMQRVTLGWIAWDLTSSASYVGFVAFLNFAPTIIIGPLFGVLVDRIKVQSAALITQASMFLLALALFASFSLGHLGLILLPILSSLSGIVASAHHPVRMSLAPRLVERSAVASVVAFTAINFNLARLTGPALGGWIIANWGVGQSLFIQVLCYLPFIFAIYFLQPRQRSSGKNNSEPFLRELSIGFRHVFHTKLIRQAVIITGIFAFIIRGTFEILPVLADGVFDTGAIGLGLLTSSAGLGALIAGMTKALMPGQIPGRLPRLALVSAAAGTGLVPLIGNSYSWHLTLFLIGCLGFTASISAISMQTAIQVDLDDDLRGRVMSLWVMTGIGATALGSIVLGFLIDQIGFAPALSWVGSLALLFLLRQVSRIW